MIKSHLCRIAKGFCKVRRIRITIPAIPQNLVKIYLFFGLPQHFSKRFAMTEMPFMFLIDSNEVVPTSRNDDSFTVFASEHNERGKLQNHKYLQKR